MIRYILTKIRNKYKLYLCLMIGNIAIIMIAAMIMMFREGSRNKLIQRGFIDKQARTETFPAYLFRNGIIKDSDLEEVVKDGDPTEYISGILDSYEESWNKYLGIPKVSAQRYVYYRNLEALFSYRGDGYLSLGYFDNNASEHYQVIDGADVHEDISQFIDPNVKIPEDAIPCVLSKDTADSLGLVVGELISFVKMSYYDSESEEPLIVLYVSGIIQENEGDYYWNYNLNDIGHMVFIDKKDMAEIIKKYPRDTLFRMDESLDYRYINTNNIDSVRSVLKQFLEKDEDLTENMISILDAFYEKNTSVEQMLYVIVLPLVVLILIFIGMIAFRIIDSEGGELTTLRNRGLSRVKLIIMYILQSIILAVSSIPFGLLAGYGFGKLVAGVDDFMGFSFSSNISVKDYSFNIWMLIAGCIGAAVAVIVMLLPVILFFKKKKNKRKNSNVPAWEKYFIDVVLLGVSIYLLFNYNKQIQILADDVIKGKGIDPVIFINSTLFLFAAGMLILRLIFYVVKLIFKMGEKTFKPITYAGLLQIMRTRKASGVISIFLVMTVAMSLFNANMARTINANKEERLKYECGTDIRVLEQWNLTLMGNPIKWKYNEPDFSSLEELKKDGTFTSMTKVMIGDRAKIRTKSKQVDTIMFMAINTKEFGETAYLRDELSPEHWYNYLNALAVENDGVIISSNMASKYEIKVGDALGMDMYPPKATGLKDSYAGANIKVVAIVDSWPGFNRYSYETDADGNKVVKEKYLAVMNYGSATNSFGSLPYEVWGKTNGSIAKGGSETSVIQQKMKEYFTSDQRRLQKVTSWKDELKEEKSSAIIQITNGLFTADFLIALLLCIIGYMIYWITSIRDRELLFGIYRAMGISRSEINRMLIIEQTFLSLMSILAGVIAGMIASKLFVKVFASVYLPQKHNVNVFINSYGGDILKMGAVLGGVILICVFWIRSIVRKLNITEALKLGDD